MRETQKEPLQHSFERSELIKEMYCQCVGGNVKVKSEKWREQELDTGPEKGGTCPRCAWPVDNDRAPVYFHVLFIFQSEDIESPRELNPSTTINDLSCKKEHQQSCCLEVIVVR